MSMRKRLAVSTSSTGLDQLDDLAVVLIEEKNNTAKAPKSPIFIFPHSDQQQAASSPSAHPKFAGAKRSKTDFTTTPTDKPVKKSRSSTHDQDPLGSLAVLER
ncbi:hypothetical protein PHYBOEH_008436 [Phytophthora boehmeriae]|uniref:Uncharacterized protein n=1 Tax=Phytophthora boehmeriae TaxID=109152 RepID=A0A8T1VZU9_9STRA|nr:hypothetical protein PHYBOEH_008436 [Phytophthora boehmeriae]